MIFLRINSPNSVQFKQYQGKSGPRVYFVQSEIFSVFTTVNINSLNTDKHNISVLLPRLLHKTLYSISRGQVSVPMMLSLTSSHWLSLARRNSWSTTS